MSLPPEIWQTIADYINDAKSWKSFLQTCNMFSGFSSNKKTLALSNPLWTLIEKYPDGNWEWYSISQNRWTNFAIISKYPDKPYNWEILVIRIDFPEEFLLRAMEIKLNRLLPDKNLIINKIAEHMDIIIRYKNLPEKFLLEHYSYLDKFYSNAIIPWEIIKKIPIDLCEHICLNNSIPFTTLEKLEILNFEYISGNPALPFWFFEKYIQREWDFNYLSSNPAITLKFIELSPDENWNWFVLSQKLDAIDIFKKFPDKPWDYAMLSANKDLTIEIITSYKRKPWNMKIVSKYMKIKLSDVRAHPEIRWDYMLLLSNNNIPLNDLLKDYTLLNNGLIIHNSLKNSVMHHHLGILSYKQAADIISNEFYGSQFILSDRNHPMQDILEHPEINWNYYHLSNNSELSWIYVDKYPELFNFDYISSNQFAGL